MTTSSSSTASLREVAHADWDPLLDRLGLTDAYLRRAYLAATAVIEEGTPTLLHLPGDDGGPDVVFVCMVRDIPGEPGARDVVTPYGYGGPVAAGEGKARERFSAGYEAWCREHGVVSTFVRFHPLLGNQGLAPVGTELVPLVGTVACRLDAERDVFAGMHSHHRRQARRARAAGVEVRIVEGPDSLDGFVELYELTMRRQGASDFYFFPPQYWQLLLGGMRDALVVAEGWLDGELIDAKLCLATPPWLHYHLGASADRAREVGASNLVFAETALWAQGAGYSRFHLGGGVGGREDSLFTFKRRFDTEGVCEAFVGKLVHDRAAYERLSGTTDTSGFFPAYRDPARRP